MNHSEGDWKKYELSLKKNDDDDDDLKWFKAKPKYSQLDFQGRQAPPQSSVIIAELCYQKCYTAAAAAVVNSTLYI